MAIESVATFKMGGVHPHECKESSAHLPIERMPPPDAVSIFLKQHVGAPSEAAVKKKDRVTAGDPIGSTGDRMGAPVHASVGGTVKGVVKTQHPVEGKASAVVIATDPEVDIPTYSAVDWHGFSREELLARIKAAGVVGMGGAAFPAHVKLDVRPGVEIDTLLINGAECEPYLTCDHRIMLEHSFEIVEAIKIMLTILGIDVCLIGIENNKPDAIEALRATIEKDPEKDKYRISVKPLAVKYPQGAADQIMESTTGRLRPAGVRSSVIGIIVQNVYTAKSIYDAVVLGKPVYERVITITGRGIARAANLLVPVGTRLVDIVNYLGGTTSELAKVVMGGPMMGYAVSTLDVPIEKSTPGVVFLSEDEIDTQPYGPCIRCGLCVEACPMGTEPNNIGIYVEAGRGAECEQFGLEKLCFECGSCAYVCPAKRPLVQFSRVARIKLMEAEKKRQKEKQKRDNQSCYL